MADGIPCMLKNDRVKLQHNAVAAQGLAVHTPVCMAMAQTAAKKILTVLHSDRLAAATGLGWNAVS